MTEKIKSDLIKEIVQFKLVKFNEHNMDVNIDKLALSTTTLSRVVKLISTNDTTGKCIAGIGAKGIPFATMIATRYNMPMVIIQPTKDIYENWKVIGDCCARTFIIVNDTINTGNTFANACDLIRSKHGNPAHCISIINIGDTIKPKHHYTDVPISSLLYINELRDEWEAMLERNTSKV